MDINPYQPPAAPEERLTEFAPGNLRQIAVAQRNALICLLLQLTIFAFYSFVLKQPDRMPRPLALINLAVLIAGAVFVYRMAIHLYSRPAAILLTVGSLVPCVGLIFLLIVNGKATKALRACDIRIGILGADLSKL